MEIQIWGYVDLMTCDHHQGDTPLGIGQDIKETNNIQKTQQPETRRAAHMIHYSMHHVLKFLNMAFDGVLMRLGLAIFNQIHLEKVLHSEGCLRLGIVTFQPIHSPVFLNKNHGGYSSSSESKSPYTCSILHLPCLEMLSLKAGMSEMKVSVEYHSLRCQPFTTENQEWKCFCMGTC